MSQRLSNPDSSRCLLTLYSKYIGLLPRPMKHPDLYMYGKKALLPNQWYDDRCAGINAIGTTVKRLCYLAGFSEEISEITH